MTEPAAQVTFTKTFDFSASFSRNGKIYGHNYTLGITTDWMDEEAEALFEEKVLRSLIKKMESRDLGLHVDFLKGAKLNDENLLAIFWPILKKEMLPLRLHRLSLRRDNRTEVVMSL
ncbi:MAG: hypothetical protein ACREH5_01880 [Candidatus Omnitrophota bacterium]